MSDEYQKPVAMDFSDPSLGLPEEPCDINLDADPFTGRSPVDDGVYLARLGTGERGFKRGLTREKQLPYVMAHIEATILNPGGDFDTRKVFNTVTTVPNSEGTSRFVGVLRAARADLTPSMSLGDQAILLKNHFDAGVETSITTRWEGRCIPCAQSENKEIAKKATFLRGQRRFPMREDGKHNHVVECPRCGEEVKATAEITKYAAA